MRATGQANRERAGAVEDSGYPAGFAVVEPPFTHEGRQQRGPRVRADLHHNLKEAHDRDQAPRGNVSHRLAQRQRRSLGPALRAAHE